MRMPDPISIVQDLIDAANRHNLLEFMTFLDDDVKARIEPTLPGSPLTVYTGKKYLQRWWQDLFDEHINIQASNFQASGNEVTWDCTMSLDRLAAMGVETVQARGHAVVEGNLIDSFTLTLTPDSARRVEEAAAREAQAG
ncbi:MAG: nuclear transport factor 2 family protein [Anaerolineae bacterium]|nr:nuclear transport factor 2 family protein [Anaerolineae bacterium]